MPFYFSGTDCRASGEAVCPGLIAGEANELVEAWLNLNGQNLMHWLKLAGEPSSTSKGLSLTFDSTHFPPGTSVEVRFKAKDSHGNFYEAAESSVVKNGAKLHDLPEFVETYGGDLASTADGIVSGLNLQRSYLSDSWPTTIAAARIARASFWVVWTHAGPNAHQCSPGQGDLVWSSIGTGDVSYDFWRAEANGFGWPPFNDTGNEPVELALLLGCKMGSSSAFLTAIEPHGTNYDPFTIRDKAVVAAYGQLFIGDGSRLADWLITSLTGGQTVHKACLQLFALASQQHLLNQPSVYTNFDGNPYGDNVLNSFSELPIYGDRFTRLTKVYTGNDFLPYPNDWFR